MTKQSARIEEQEPEGPAIITPMHRQDRDLSIVAGTKKGYRLIDRLEWLYEHKHIAQHQRDAGRKLQEDWQLSKMEISARSDLSGGRGGGSAQSTLPDAKLDAMTRLGKAMAVLPPECETLVSLFLLTEGECFSLERCASLINRDRRAALPLLQVGLSLLSRHYGCG